MELLELPRGEEGPENSDRVRLTRTIEDGRYSFMGLRLKGVVTDHTVWAESFDTEEEAFTAALVWAEGEGVEELYIERPEV